MCLASLSRDPFEDCEEACRVHRLHEVSSESDVAGLLEVAVLPVATDGNPGERQAAATDLAHEFDSAAIRQIRYR